MPFSDTIKEGVKERAHLRCCVCRERFATCVHHIVPEASGGPSTEDNAAPLCPACHFEYGNNPDMRNFIRQSRDLWYKLCDRKSSSDREVMREMLDRFGQYIATKDDLQKAVLFLTDQMQSIMRQPLSTSTQIRKIADMTLSFSDVVSDPPFAICPVCQTRYAIDASKCPNCGWPDELLDVDQPPSWY